MVSNTSDIHDDSRKIQPGDVFYATRGDGYNGRQYIREALKAGAACVVVPVGSEVEGIDPQRIRFSENTNVEYALACRAYFGYPDKELSIIGITGTNGKTSTVALTASLLNQLMPVSHPKKGWATSGTLGLRYNNELIEPLLNTTPDAKSFYRMLRKLVDEGYAGLVCEVSSHGIELGRIAGCEFDSAALTNLSHDHLDFHLNMNRYFEQKASFCKQVGKRVWINTDNAWGQKLAEQIPHACHYGKAGCVRLHTISHVRDGHGLYSHLTFELIAQQTFPHPQPTLIELIAHTSQAAFPENIGLALGLAGQWVSLPPRIDISATRAPGRCELFRGKRGQTIVIDYAHTPDALEHVLEAVRRLYPSKRLRVIFGCGGDRDRHKRAPMGLIAARLADRVYLTNDNPRTEDPEKIVAAIVAGMPKTCVPDIDLDRAQMIRSVLGSTSEDDIVVIAGKGHEEYQIIGTKKIPLKDIDICMPFLVNSASLTS